MVKASSTDHYDFMFRWLASYPKSGNTWVRLAVHAYRTGSADINRMGNISDTCRAAWQAASLQPLEKITEGMALMVRPAAMLNLQKIIASIPYERPLIKTHAANVCVCDISQIPTPITYGAVHIVRDPRDVVVSWAHHFDVTYDQAIYSLNDPGNATSPDNMLQVITSWSNHTATWQQAHNAKTWRYEDMLADPRTAFRQIIEHIDDEVDEDRLQTALEMTSLDALKAAESEKGFAEAKNGAFFRSGKVGGYKDVLTGKQISRIERAHGDKMREFGYL
jgi:hypothetical protein